MENSQKSKIKMIIHLYSHKFSSTQSNTNNFQTIGTTTPGQSEPGSNGNEGVIHTPQTFRTGASPPDAI